MLIYQHLEGQTFLGELQKFRMHNVASLSTGSTPTATGLLQYLTTNNTLHLHVGSDVWRRIAMAGDTMPATGISLANGKIWMGDGSNIPQETLINTIPISNLGAATGNVSMGGNKITSLGTPTLDNDAATKLYVDSVAQGIDAKGSCLLATNGALPACTYSGGALTLTANANGALLNTNIDSTASGVTIAVNDRILVKNQAVSEQNGIYIITVIGSAGAPWVLTRAADANTNLELESAFTFVEQGASANSGFVQTSDDYDITAVSSKLITWTIFSSAGSFFAGKGLILSGGNTFNFAKSGAYAQGDMFYGITGGAGDAATTKIDILTLGASGRILQSNGTAPTWTSYTLPTSIPAANALLRSDGTNFVSLLTANNSLLVTNGSGVVSWGTALPAGTTLNGNTIYSATGTDVALADGGTNASLSASQGSVVYGTASAMAFSSVGTSGHFLRSGGTGAPTWFNLFATSNTWTDNQHSVRALSTDSAFSATVTGDTVWRWYVNAAGMQVWGDGTAAHDCSFRRSAASQMTMVGSLILAKFSSTQSFLQLNDLDDTHSIRLIAPATVTTSKTWVLPQTDGSGFFMKSDGSGNLSMAAISTSDITGRAALTTSTTSNVTLTLGGAHATAVFGATSITAGWSGVLATDRGGTGLGTVMTNGVLIGNNTGTMSVAIAADDSVLGLTSGGSTVFQTQPTLAVGLITRGQESLTIRPFGALAGNTGEIRFLELVAGGTNYVGFKAPDAITGNVIWTLPAADAVGVLKSNGSGGLTFGPVTAGDVGSGAELSRVNDSNVTLTLGGSPTTAVLAATSITVGWSGLLPVSRGGTGQGTNLTQYGMVYASTTTAMASTAAPGVTGAVLRGNTAGAPTWTGYSLPATLAGSNRLLLSSSSTAVAELAPTADRVLVTNGSSVVSWGGLLNVARNTAGGIARKWSNLVTGDGSNAYISVTHNLNTRDVVVMPRNANAGDTGSQEVGYTKITVEDANTVRIYFNAVQTGSNYYVVTVVG